MGLRDRFSGVSSVNQFVGTVFGGVYIAVGILGSFVTTDGFAATTGGKLADGFEVNPLHNIAHILIGAVLLATSLAGHDFARATNLIVGGAYLLLGVLGLFILDSKLNILALNGADNVLHLGSALVLLGIALGGERLLPQGRAGSPQEPAN
jgi:hypothetical protein